MKLTHRSRMDLSGLWIASEDRAGKGEEEGWYRGLPHPARRLYVPSPWNGQAPELEGYMGIMWYEKSFHVPSDWKQKVAWIWFEGVNYKCKVWINGSYLGAHEGGFTSFKFRIDKWLRFGDVNKVVVKVDNTLTPECIPPGEGMNRTYFDFFHYGGIIRPVYLEATSRTFINDLTIYAEPEGNMGFFKALIEVVNELRKPFKLVLEVLDYDTRDVIHRVEAKGDRRSRQDFMFEEEIKGIEVWDIDHPKLYLAKLSLISEEGDVLDVYEDHFGFRRVEIKNGKILLNGKPIFLLGFGRHEDFPITGKTMPGAVLVRDFNLMKGVRANSFRTSHYPYSRLHLDLADLNGFLVILETPAVGLKHRHFKDKRYLEKLKVMVREMIAEHKNRPSVIAYSMANEPESDIDEAHEFFKELYNFIKEIDPTRPITFVSNRHLMDKALDVVDFICLNVYFGWYSHHGDIEAGVKEALGIIQRIHEKYPSKPIMISEVGAGAVPGYHHDPPVMWSEEYQAEMLSRYLEELSKKEYVVGIHIWNFADFRTPQSHYRVILNHKGIFTWIRQPKLAARVIKEKFSSIMEKRRSK